MYLRLKNQMALRGWEKLPYALCDYERKGVAFLDKTTFDALLLCDGNTPIGPVSTLPLHYNIIEKAKDNGVVEECRQGKGLYPWQKYHLYPSRYIMRAHWSITGRCNYKCRHCYMSAPDAKFGELSHEQCIDIIDQMHDCGVMATTLTGGEALVRDDFWEIVDRLLAYKIDIQTVYSNGELITSETLDAFEKRKIQPSIALSFDGVGWHDWLRGIDGAEEVAINALKLCRDRGFDTSTEMCLHQHNKHTLRESVYLLASLGVGTMKTNPASRSGAWIENGGEDSLELDELYQLYLDYIPHYFEDGSPINIQLGGFFMAKKGAKEYFLPSVKGGGCEHGGSKVICAHARNVMYISAESRVLPCMSLSGLDIQHEYPLITEIGLSKCLTDSHFMRLVGMTVDEFLEDCPECDACEFKYQCLTGCRASAYESGGNFMGPDRAVCKFYKGEYIPKIIEAAKGYKCVNYEIEN